MNAYIVVPFPIVEPCVSLFFIRISIMISFFIRLNDDDANLAQFP